MPRRRNAAISPTVTVVLPAPLCVPAMVNLVLIFILHLDRWLAQPGACRKVGVG
jgi:hypothetical protein